MTTKRLQCKGFLIIERKDGSFRIKSRRVTYDANGMLQLAGYYETIAKDWYDAGSVVYELANNSEHGTFVNHKMCETWGKNFI